MFLIFLSGQGVLQAQPFIFHQEEDDDDHDHETNQHDDEKKAIFLGWIDDLWHPEGDYDLPNQSQQR